MNPERNHKPDDDTAWFESPTLPMRQDDLSRGGASDGSDGSSRSPTRFDDLLWELGWTDGRVEQPSDNGRKILAARSELGRIATERNHKEQAARRRALAQELEEREATARQRLAADESFLDELESQWKENPGQFSWASGAINIFMALVVLMADIPLSLSLVATGFGVKTRDEDFSVDVLLTAPWDVFQRFWEAVLLCAGVALLGMFFKILCEDLLDAALKSARWQKFYRFFMIGVGAVLLGTIVLLGFLRSQVNEAKRDLLADEQSLLEETGSTVDEDRASAEATLSAELPAFILLAVVFPVVGGVAFAVGWRKFQNWQVLWRSRRKVTAARDELTALRQELARMRAEVEGWGVTSAEAVSRSLATLWESLYLHGYERGRKIPETLTGKIPIFERFERSFHRLMAKAMR